MDEKPAVDSLSPWSCWRTKAPRFGSLGCVASIPRKYGLDNQIAEKMAYAFRIPLISHSRDLGLNLT